MNELFEYHNGEIEVQKRTGEEAIARRNGRVIQHGVIPKAIPFIQDQTMLVLASIDTQKQPWVSILFGEPGFINANETQITINLNKTVNNSSDIFWQNMESQKQVGLLVIEFSSRRRMRANGFFSHTDKNHIVIHVDYSYPNCPKYIQRRQLRFSQEVLEHIPKQVQVGSKLEESLLSIITSADTMFVGSLHPNAGVDASHRGGKQGFMKVMDEKTIRIPDYSGNSMYNTLGNFVTNPVAGITIPDFTTGACLQLTGKVQIHWDLPEEELSKAGTNRYWDFFVEQWKLTQDATPQKWEYLDESPFNP